jgi:hypothetical protein
LLLLYDKICYGLRQIFLVPLVLPVVFAYWWQGLSFCRQRSQMFKGSFQQSSVWDYTPINLKFINEILENNFFYEYF